MKTPYMRRALSAALTGLALAAITQISYAGRDGASDTERAGLPDASQLAPAPAMAEPRRAGRGSPVTLYIEIRAAAPSGSSTSKARVGGMSRAGNRLLQLRR